MTSLYFILSFASIEINLWRSSLIPLLSESMPSNVSVFKAGSGNSTSNEFT
jgi:hypothetical protein